ncbi:hypothetical protein [Demequina sp. NBRC 110051]|uniref:hypothetical protein n=1 Tax=Demequina sp. NBRC 110051 TaxID=1570340 RepID=UPI00117FA55C|nr:hypothetical protein [Demequina sp. NBRC 110051]
MTGRNRASRDRKPRWHFRLVTALAIATGLASLLLHQASSPFWQWMSSVLVSAFAGFVLLFAGLWIERRLEGQIKIAAMESDRKNEELREELLGDIEDLKVQVASQISGMRDRDLELFSRLGAHQVSREDFFLAFERGVERGVLTYHDGLLVQVAENPAVYLRIRGLWDGPQRLLGELSFEIADDTGNRLATVDWLAEEAEEIWLRRVAEVTGKISDDDFDAQMLLESISRTLVFGASHSAARPLLANFGETVWLAHDGVWALTNERPRKLLEPSVLLQYERGSSWEPPAGVERGSAYEGFNAACVIFPTTDEPPF